MIEEPTPTRSILCVEIDEHRLALEESVVREVLAGGEWVLLPSACAGLVGVLPFAGRAVAVLAVESLLGVPSAARVRARTVIVETLGAILALPVDRVHEPRLVDAERPAHAIRMAHARHEIDVDGKTMPLFDVTDFVRSLVPAH